MSGSFWRGQGLILPKASVVPVYFSLQPVAWSNDRVHGGWVTTTDLHSSSGLININYYIIEELSFIDIIQYHLKNCILIVSAVYV